MQRCPHMLQMARWGEMHQDIMFEELVLPAPNNKKQLPETGKHTHLNPNFYGFSREVSN